MVNTTTNTNLSLRPILERCRLNGENYLDWDRNVRLVFRQERKEYVLDQAIPEEPAPNATKAIKDVYQKHVNDVIDVGCVLVGCMETDLQKQFMELSNDLYAMMAQIKEMFKEKAPIERYDTL